MKDAATINQRQPKGRGEDIAKLVLADIESRVKKGEETYGERLKPNNGRDALVDAYQEALDLCLYLRQEIEERRLIKIIEHKDDCICHLCLP
jgi:hypothetical protein